MTEPTANELFQNYYSAVTGTMAASVHGDRYQWRNGGEDFPYPEQAKWTDFYPSITTCNGEEIAHISTGFRTYNQDLGLNPEETSRAIEKVKTYWASRGWEITSTNTAEDPHIVQITTTTDSGIHLKYLAGAGGEVIRASTPCIPGFYDKYRDEGPPRSPSPTRPINPTWTTSQHPAQALPATHPGQEARRNRADAICSGSLPPTRS